MSDNGVRQDEEVEVECFVIELPTERVGEMVLAHLNRRVLRYPVSMVQCKALNPQTNYWWMSIVGVRETTAQIEILVPHSTVLEAVTDWMAGLGSALSYLPNGQHPIVQCTPLAWTENASKKKFTVSAAIEDEDDE